jgi:iron(III) transport system ATP-binding protein
MVLNKGKIEQIGSPFELYSHPQSLFVADFIGQANVLPATVEMTSGSAATVDLYGKRFEFRAVADSGHPQPGPASVVLRPENITLAKRGTALLPAMVRQRFFVGDHMEYDVELPGGKMISVNIPYAPGMESFESGNAVDLNFADNAPVVIFQS